MQRNPYLSQTVLDGLELARRRHLEEVAAIDALITRREPVPASIGLIARKTAHMAAKRTGHTAAGKGTTTTAAVPAGKAPTPGVTAPQAPPKRKLSEAGKKKIRAALKKRWANYYAAKEEAKGAAG